MKIAFLDKDGTLVKPIADEVLPQSPTDQMLLPGVAERVGEMKADGWKLVIVSNQGGVEKGYKPLEDAISEMRFCLSLLPEIEYAYFCPDLAGDVCYAVPRSIRHEYVPGRPHEEIVGAIKVHYSAEAKRLKLNGTYRKPKTGMLQAAIGEFYVYKDRVMIGNRPEDDQCAANAGVRFIDAKQWRETPWTSKH